MFLLRMIFGNLILPKTFNRRLCKYGQLKNYIILFLGKLVLTRALCVEGICLLRNIQILLKQKNQNKLHIEFLAWRYLFKNKKLKNTQKEEQHCLLISYIYNSCSLAEDCWLGILLSSWEQIMHLTCEFVVLTIICSSTHKT